MHLFLASPVARGPTKNPDAIHIIVAISAALQRPGNSKLSANACKKKVPGVQEIAKQHPCAGINFHNESAQCYAVWQLSRLSGYALSFEIPQQLPDSPSSFAYPMVPSPAYWKFRSVESFSARRIASSSRIFYKPGHFAELFRCATVRSNSLAHGIIYIKYSKFDGI